MNYEDTMSIIEYLNAPEDSTEHRWWALQWILSEVPGFQVDPDSTISASDAVSRGITPPDTFGR